MINNFVQFQSKPQLSYTNRHARRGKVKTFTKFAGKNDGNLYCTKWIIVVLLQALCNSKEKIVFYL